MLYLDPMKRKRHNASGYRDKRRKHRKSRFSTGKTDRFYTKKHIFLSRMGSILKVSPKLAKDFFSQRTVSTIRLNPLAGDTQEIYQKLRQKGLEMQRVEWAPDTYIVTNKDKSELGDMPEYEKGMYYIQNLSSMIPPLVLNPVAGENILDMCAAPGSKTTQICAITLNRANIVALENDFKRGIRMQQLLPMFHARNVKVRIVDANEYADGNAEQFDKILLDAPCSGEGMVYMQSENALRYWSIKKAKALSKLQKKLIVSAYKLLKPGGTLVYSTCTLEPMENEEVVDHLLEREAEAYLEEIDLHKTPEFADYARYITPGITKWSGHTYSAENKKTIRVIPSKYTEGFFVAKIRKPGE